jgi:hypothetical protein
MKMLAQVVALLMLTVMATAQPLIQNSLSLEMPKGNDTYGGYNSGDVVWHPGLKCYYATMIGNKTYPMARFSTSGTVIETKNAVGADIRGLWYNLKTKKLQFNAYNKNGWGNIPLSAKGEIGEAAITNEGLNQPSDNAVGRYDAKKNVVYFFDADKQAIVSYNATTTAQGKTINIFLGAAKATEKITDKEKKKLLLKSYNSDPVFTGIANREIAFLNVDTKTIEFYNLKTGLLTHRRILPTIDFDLHSSFSFGFSNKMFWLFNKEKRTWHSFK